MDTTETRPTVMVADDSEDIRELVRLQLTRLGYRVIEATNGREAVAAVDQECPALILMDITMPVLDGLDATRMIRGMAERCGVVIIAFTALHGAGYRESALAAGCDDYLPKPFDLGQLSHLLNRHLQGSIE
jgi:two-component system, cell cycle response regulator DivK